MHPVEVFITYFPHQYFQWVLSTTRLFPGILLVLCFGRLWGAVAAVATLWSRIGQWRSHHKWKSRIERKLCHMNSANGQSQMWWDCSFASTSVFFSKNPISTLSSLCSLVLYTVFRILWSHQWRLENVYNRETKRLGSKEKSEPK